MANKQNIAIIGAGGFGREVFHILDNDLYNCVGFIDNEKKENLPAPIIGIDSDIAKLMGVYGFSGCSIAIGDIKKRKVIYNNIEKFAIEFPLIIDSSVKCFSKDIQEGAIFYPGVVIMNNCKIGKFTLLNSGVTLGHDVVIGDHCHISTGTIVNGEVSVGNCSFFGSGAVARQSILIGNNCIIGAGVVVKRDIKPDQVIKN